MLISYPPVLLTEIQMFLALFCTVFGKIILCQIKHWISQKNKNCYLTSHLQKKRINYICCVKNDDYVPPSLTVSVYNIPCKTVFLFLCVNVRRIETDTRAGNCWLAGIRIQTIEKKNDKDLRKNCTAWTDKICISQTDT